MIAAIYARKSTAQEIADEQKSVARQVEHARQYAARKGWKVDEASVYVDDGISGAEFAKRPAFMRMMAALKPQPRFQVLIMSEESRLGRESIEVSFALKQLVQSGVRVFCYLDDRERTLDSPIEKAMLALQTMSDEMERERARQRATDKALSQARAGHVAGGRVFGYDNVDVVDASGRRSHVIRQINDAEACVIRQIFKLSAEGLGIKAIAKRLNAEGAVAPRAQLGRSMTWAPSSVREVLYRDLHRGLITWNRSKKRDRWGAHHQTSRPPADWITTPAPHLAIVTEDEWRAAHARLAAAREIYGNDGKGGGRPPLGSPSKYLMTNLAQCGRCGEALRVRSRKNRANSSDRRFFYGCAGYHDRGVCTNGADVPMADADLVLIEALLDDVLDPSIIKDSIEFAIGVLRGDDAGERRDDLEKDLGQVARERRQLQEAIRSGRTVTGLLEALQALDDRQAGLESQRAAIASQRRLRASDVATMRRDLTTVASTWRQVLAEDPTNARPIVTALLEGRVTITPAPRARVWQLRGKGTLDGLFSREIFPSVWRPHRDSNPGFSLERAAS